MRKREGGKMWGKKTGKERVKGEGEAPRGEKEGVLRRRREST